MKCVVCLGAIGAPIALAVVIGLFATPAVGQENVGTVQQGLVRGANTQMWTENDNHIPMCWHEFNGFMNNAQRDLAKGFVALTIQEGWINPLNLTISWQECPTQGDEKQVRVMLREGDASTNGTTIRAGVRTLSNATERLSRPPNDPPGLLMGFPATWNDSDEDRAGFRSLILHEFGRILGFGHEFSRPDGPEGSPCHTDPIESAVAIGPSDSASIMAWSYCTLALGALSPDDMRGARSVYGTGRSGSNDFNDDGRGDVVWHNAATGETQIWFMSVASRIGRATVVDEGGEFIPIGPPFSIVASNDMNSDGCAGVGWPALADHECQ